MVKGPLKTNPVLAVAAAYAAARGVAPRAVAGYVLVWAMVAAASRVSISALGLQFLPDGSGSLDTIAVLLMLFPATVLGRCLSSQVPTVEATRSRRRQPAQLLWVGAIAAIAVISPWTVATTLHRSVDPAAFQHAWYLTVGSVLILSCLISPLWTMAGTFTLLALFSTPGLVPWSANLFYNLAIKDTAAGIAALVFVAGVLLAAMTSPTAANLTGRLDGSAAERTIES